MTLALILVGGGPARAAGVTLTVSLSPASIAADGASQSTATVSVLPPLRAQPLALYAPFDSHISVGPVHDNGDGTYTATLTSSRSAEVTRIFATDALGTDQVFPATLTQVGASVTSVVAVTNRPASPSNPPVTNEGVVLLATVTSLADNLAAPTGTISFNNRGSPIAGCQALPTSAQGIGSVNVTCVTSFAATPSPAELTAVFTPAAGSLLSGSESPADDFPVASDLTSTSVTSTSTPVIGAPETYVATVTPGHAGAVAPTGFVRFFDHGATIASCRQQPLDGSSTATCTVTYPAPGTHAIRASYSGDANFQSSDSIVLRDSAQILGTIDASMQWRFRYTSRDTRVLELILSRAPVGSRVSITCSGGGCQFKRSTVVVRAPWQCGPAGSSSCASGRTVNLTPQISQPRLRAHTRLTVAITKPGWTGKAYVFAVRASLPPTVQIGCIAPGSNRIAASC
ncbi:MAG: Ig-like domain repeat protein [Solirubrobacterales bacterium]|nr:Ig-like domain repeat protein [Solirubrobacterales bacterium]